MTLWDDFWNWAETSQLGSNVVGGLIVALVVAVIGLVASVVKKSWREKIWGGVARFFRWVGTIRVTTTDRIEKYERGANDGWVGHERAADAGAKPEDLQHEPQAPPPAPQPAKAKLPPPRWSIRRKSKDDPKSYVLINWEPASHAGNIRLDAPADTFDFYDKARWDELEYMGDYSRDHFSGHVKGKGRTDGVMFTVTWVDDLGTERSTQAHLERPPRIAPSVTVL